MIFIWNFKWTHFLLVGLIFSSLSCRTRLSQKDMSSQVQSLGANNFKNSKNYFLHLTGNNDWNGAFGELNQHHFTAFQVAGYDGIPKTNTHLLSKEDIIKHIKAGAEHVNSQGTYMLLIGAHGSKSGDFCTKERFTAKDVANALRIKNDHGKIKLFGKLIVVLNSCSSKNHREQFVTEFNATPVALNHLIVSSDSIGKITAGPFSWNFIKQLYKSDIDTTWAEFLDKLKEVSKMEMDNRDGKYTNSAGWSFVPNDKVLENQKIFRNTNIAILSQPARDTYFKYRVVFEGITHAKDIKDKLIHRVAFTLADYENDHPILFAIEDRPSLFEFMNQMKKGEVFWVYTTTIDYESTGLFKTGGIFAFELDTFF